MVSTFFKHTLTLWFSIFRKKKKIHTQNSTINRLNDDDDDYDDFPTLLIKGEETTGKGTFIQFFCVFLDENFLFPFSFSSSSSCYNSGSSQISFAFLRIYFYGFPLKWIFFPDNEFPSDSRNKKNCGNQWKAKQE